LDEPYGIADVVLSGFLRVVTHPKVFAHPTPLSEGIAFCNVLRSQPNATVLAPGPRHWQIFTNLCNDAGARGNLIPDAYLAALAIESGSEWITTDGDYRRFRGLRLRHPLDE
jgi:toxin-antitoxin system PIN domain toxin